MPQTAAADSCLIVVDVQNDFMPGGALAVPRGDEVVPVINALAARFENVVLTQDWHPRGHASFASSHPGRKPFETIELPYGDAGAVAGPLRAGHRGGGFPSRASLATGPN